MLLLVLIDCLQIRSFAAVLFRRVATRSQKIPGVEESKEVFYCLPEPQKQAIRQKLLECLQSEREKTVRHKIGDAVAEIARQYAEAGVYRDMQWFGSLRSLKEGQGKFGPIFCRYCLCPVSHRILDSERSRSGSSTQHQASYRSSMRTRSAVPSPRGLRTQITL